MKRVLKLLTTITMAAVLFTACQNPAGGDSGKGPEKTPEDNKEYTISFDLNIPKDTSDYWYGCNNNTVPESQKGKKDAEITLPNSSCKYTKYTEPENKIIADYTFLKWNTKADGSGDNLLPGCIYIIQGDATLYAVYEEKLNGSGSPSGDYIDMSITSEYEMEIGDKVQLYCEGQDEYFIEDGTDVISIDADNVMEAIGAGTATVKVTIKDSIQSYRMIVTVKSGTPGNRDLSLAGKWVDGENYLQFNLDGTGYLKYEDTLDISCNWSTYTGGGKNWVKITNAAEGTNKDYAYTISGSTLKVEGRMAFKMPSTTTWTKE